MSRGNFFPLGRCGGGNKLSKDDHCGHLSLILLHFLTQVDEGFVWPTVQSVARRGPPLHAPPASVAGLPIIASRQGANSL
jgi:hypothetical protein